MPKATAELVFQMGNGDICAGCECRRLAIIYVMVYALVCVGGLFVFVICY